ncbi:hypothetical protein MWU75_11875 [Ornithinimicrobium sp. F0845]|uniref:hypothetical protein n=1 Tax=Ornithinimicrobium sp. F0845 TaxID=2926412 RepID=UPI001FF67548|nr:hypothetical protein [Ornithinimicrobium sp. F0845]MCK0112838.1 hypothetical protein [Ornithinimicrobium sp. F0845]
MTDAPSPDPDTCFLGQLCMPQGDWATWVGSVGVVITLIVTLALIYRERRLRLASQKQRIEERLRAQAEQVTAWLEVQDFAPGLRAAALNNASTSVVYQVLVFLVAPDVSGQRTSEELAASNAAAGIQAVDVLPPGRWRVGLMPLSSARSDVRLALELAFTDQSGRYWVRRSDGRIESFDVEPIAHFGLTDVRYISARSA